MSLGSGQTENLQLDMSKETLKFRQTFQTKNTISNCNKFKKNLTSIKLTNLSYITLKKSPNVTKLQLKWELHFKTRILQNATTSPVKKTLSFRLQTKILT